MVSLPLGDRLKKWFTEVSEVNQFDAVMHLAPTYSEEEILKVLPEYADLVRGLWVCKSSLLFNDGLQSLVQVVLWLHIGLFKSSNNVYCSYSMQAIIRDLRQLAAKYASNRKDASKLQALANAAKSCASLPHEELEEMLKTISVPVHGVYIAKQTERNTLRNILIYLFRKKEPNATLTKQEILDAAAVHLKREVSEKEYHQVWNTITMIYGYYASLCH
ncbi:hypothetical protein PR202_ga27798 [Eleusine coracana subsp. coracana]|uniref:Uncharacterized protein n=1 Tax=Eleusine coracana subsp. coracana TaxID=191504 RepID=A0AAV5DFE5_ELECO|nr:hypothetical protein PR202_ga27798 [Eleusine coracana subsp. coracana]